MKYSFKFRVKVRHSFCEVKVRVKIRFRDNFVRLRLCLGMKSHLSGRLCRQRGRPVEILHRCKAPLRRKHMIFLESFSVLDF